MGGVRLNERTELLSFDFASVFFIKKNHLQMKKSRPNIEKRTETPDKGSDSEKALSCPKGIQVPG